MITEMIPKAQKNTIRHSLLHIEGFMLYTNFNPEIENLGEIGILGVAIYVKETLESSEICMQPTYNDHIWVEIKLVINTNILCGCVYRSPSNDIAENIESTTVIEQLIIKTSTVANTHLLIAGDFNLKGVDGENHCVDTNQHHLTSFVNTIQECFLYQHVTHPTQHRIHETPNLLDLIITNEGLLSSLEHFPGLGKSDHECLLFDANVRTEYHTSNVPGFNISKANYRVIECNLDNVDWEHVLSFDIKQAFPEFINLLEQCMQGNIPVRVSPRKRRNIYLTPEAIKLKNRKNKLCRSYSRTRMYYDHQRFLQYRIELRTLTRSLRASIEENIVRKVKHKLKLFWKYINSRQKTQVKIPTLNLDDGLKATSLVEKVEALSKYFCSVFNIENTEQIPPPMYKFHGEQLITVNITPDIVKEKLFEPNYQ